MMKPGAHGLAGAPDPSRLQRMYRLIYKSDSTVKVTWGVATNILETSTRNNQRDGLTGILLLGKKHFLQVLEGDFATVNATFQRISRDPRHENVRIVAFGEAEERLFAKWEMRGVGVFEFDPPIAQSLMDKYGEEGGVIRFPERDWEALSLLFDIQRLGEIPEWEADESA